MFTKDDLLENRSIIVMMVEKHRREMEVLSSTVGEMFGGPSAKDYYAYSRTLSDEELVGVYSTALAQPEAIIRYCDVLDGTISFEEMIEETIGLEVLGVYANNMIFLKE